ncbi:hypothetical protein BpHYR1_052060 [Brachionus plicatilis]|uniref:Uncharacterized protein n=1 Tax=Brachionus plicatilis TaxID=10195 RepID=A0A3M7Q1Y2_BRAPC|nr:hypothetical protein BpHYR1_052060 [Brachionus plicatilis]
MGGLGAEQHVRGHYFVVLAVLERVVYLIFGIVELFEKEVYASLVGHVQLRLGVGRELVVLVAHVHPFVFHDGVQGGALGRIENEKFFEQILAIGGHVEGNAVFAAQYSFAQLL